jgi:hypothetical protein
VLGGLSKKLSARLLFLSMSIFLTIADFTKSGEILEIPEYPVANRGNSANLSMVEKIINV